MEEGGCGEGGRKEARVRESMSEGVMKARVKSPLLPEFRARSTLGTILRSLPALPALPSGSRSVVATSL